MHGIAASRREGSTCDAQFASSEQLRAARIAVRAARSQAQGAGGREVYAWLDVAMTKAETEPARMNHRACEYFTDLEKVEGRAGAISKNIAAKTVPLGETRLGFSCRGVWKWSPSARARYTEAELQDGKEWIEAE